MKLKFAIPLSPEDLLIKNYDLIIVASGYESRATKLVSSINLKSSFNVVISFREHKELKQRIINDKYFKNLKFQEFLAGEGKPKEIIEILDNVLSGLKVNKKITVLVDYSCMTKVWYSTIINYFQHKKTGFEEVRLSFSYTPSEFSEPQAPMPNKYMGPLPGIFRVSASNKPTALIIGLGYELERARGIVEYLDPHKTIAFYSKPAFNVKFEEKIKTNNLKFFENLSQENLIPYPVANLKATDELLTSLCLSLKKEYRIILAPLGPKPFALLCMLLASRYSDIDIWRVSAGSFGNTYDRKAADVPPVICEAIFEKE